MNRTFAVCLCFTVAAFLTGYWACILDPLHSQDQSANLSVQETAPEKMEKSFQEHGSEELATISTAKEYLEFLDHIGLHGHYPRFPRMDLNQQEAEIVVAELRKRYPYISLSQRLKNVNDRERIEAMRKLYRATDHFKQAASSGGSQPSDSFYLNRRAQALMKLHSESAAGFVAADGFGLFRMPLISPRDLKYPSHGPIALRTKSGTEALYGDTPIVELPSQPDSVGSPMPRSTFASPQFPTADSSSLSRLPTVESVMALNTLSKNQFLSPNRIGDVKESQMTAGFIGHGIDEVHSSSLEIELSSHANSNGWPNTEGEAWDLNRLELVSLLMHDEFRVYVSESLPRMEELKDVETRKLDMFEFLGVGRLLQGEDVIIEARTNRIRMLGSLRASESCLECHTVKQNELLGALSYELIRRNPIEK